MIWIMIYDKSHVLRKNTAFLHMMRTPKKELFGILLHLLWMGILHRFVSRCFPCLLLFMSYKVCYNVCFFCCSWQTSTYNDLRVWKFFQKTCQKSLFVVVRYVVDISWFKSFRILILCVSVSVEEVIKCLCYV